MLSWGEIAKRDTLWVCEGLREMTQPAGDILVLEDDITLGQLLCNMIRMYRLGDPYLSLSEVDACQMLRERDFKLCFLGLRLRSGVCKRAVAEADARMVPTLLMVDSEGLQELVPPPRRGLVLQMPAREEVIRAAAVTLLGQNAAG